MTSHGIANARMYAVTPVAEASWRLLLEHIAEDAGLILDYLPYPAPQPLEELWRRSDLACVLMCGYPIATRLADVVPIAAPVPDVAWAHGRAVYRTDLIVRADSPFRTLEDAFGGSLGWTVEHSHSGFNALRHHLLDRRPAGHASAFKATRGGLVTARRVLDSVLDGSITVGPLDAYWHQLIRHHDPALLDGVRILDSTELAPMPAFVMSASRTRGYREQLVHAFGRAARQPWFPPLGQALCLTGFETVTQESFAPTLAWERAAIARGYTVPA